MNNNNRDLNVANRKGLKNVVTLAELIGLKLPLYDLCMVLHFETEEH